MAQESQETRETTHARIYKDQKKRVKRIAITRTLAEEHDVTEISVLAEILERELPKYEKKLGI